MTVYRGLRLNARQLRWLRPRVGRPLSRRSHGWWATQQGIAIVYALTPSVRPSADDLIPVLLSAELEGPIQIFSPTLPDLRTIPGVKLTLISLQELA